MTAEEEVVVALAEENNAEAVRTPLALTARLSR